MIPRKNIHVHPSSSLMDSGIKEAMSCLAPVRFMDCPDIAACKPGDAVVNLLGNDEICKEAIRRGIRCFHVANGIAESKLAASGARIQFGNSGHLDRLLRGRTISHKALPDFPVVRAEAGDEVLARAGESPVWVLKRGADTCADIVSASLPKLADGEQPFDYLDGQQFIQLLPLLHFLRQVTTDTAWTRPPLRACLMFDDPNLHRLSYGYMSYKELVKQAKKFGYHVALATVPLDAWGPHRRTVELFKDNPAQISLLIHGNDHTRGELGGARTQDEYLQLLAQSLERIARLEEKTGLNIARVMVPPHEILAEAALAAMLALGFEGASLTPWMLRYWNARRQWPPAFGLEIAEMVNGIPVLPRFDLSVASEGPVVISAFLGRPIVLFEHHEALAGGLELLSQTAEMVNSLGDVCWCSPESMLRSNHLAFQKSAMLWVKPYSCRARFIVPQDVTSVVVISPEKEPAADVEYVVNRKRGTELQTVRVTAGVPVIVSTGDTIELVLSKLGTVNYREIEKPGLSLPALSRRVFCEGRDRLVPLMPRLRKV